MLIRPQLVLFMTLLCVTSYFFFLFASNQFRCEYLPRVVIQIKVQANKIQWANATPLFWPMIFLFFFSYVCFSFLSMATGCYCKIKFTLFNRKKREKKYDNKMKIMKTIEAIVNVNFKAFFPHHFVPDGIEDVERNVKFYINNACAILD